MNIRIKTQSGSVYGVSGVPQAAVSFLRLLAAESILITWEMTGLLH
jgi:hypothetical protein